MAVSLVEGTHKTSSTSIRVNSVNSVGVCNTVQIVSWKIVNAYQTTTLNSVTGTLLVAVGLLESKLIKVLLPVRPVIPVAAAGLATLNASNVVATAIVVMTVISLSNFLENP